MSDSMMTTTEHTIPVEGLHFNRAKQITEHPDAGTGEVFLSAFNVPKAFHIVLPSASTDLYVKVQYQNSEPSEPNPREVADMNVTLAKNSKKVVEIKLPRSAALLKGQQVPEIPPDFIKTLESTFKGSQRFTFSMSVNLTNSILRAIWPSAVKHIASLPQAHL